jgi:hypothetical protein
MRILKYNKLKNKVQNIEKKKFIPKTRNKKVLNKNNF